MNTSYLVGGVTAQFVTSVTSFCSYHSTAIPRALCHTESGPQGQLTFPYINVHSALVSTRAKIVCLFFRDQ